MPKKKTDSQTLEEMRFIEARTKLRLMLSAALEDWLDKNPEVGNPHIAAREFLEDSLRMIKGEDEDEEALPIFLVMSRDKGSDWKTNIEAPTESHARVIFKRSFPTHSIERVVRLNKKQAKKIKREDGFISTK